MNLSDVYIQTIIISTMIIVSYFFNFIARKTNIPSVLLLIGLGIGIHEIMKVMDFDFDYFIMEALELVGVVGLIMIVLEGALDLELKKEKRPLLIKSFLVALFSLVITTVGIAFILNEYLFNDYFTSLLYAIPLSILSSAIIIPSVGHLIPTKKEFLVYESTFSDILGIMFFYFLIGNSESSSAMKIITDVSGGIALTIALSLVISYTLVILLQRLHAKVKLFFLIAVLVLLYSTGKMFHLSSLLIILVFGLVLRNYSIFFKGRLIKLINKEALHEIKEDFHIVTMESAFVVRTFFFIIFGVTLNFAGIVNTTTILLSLAILVLMYIVRYILLKIFVRKNITPQQWIAPRGLITILLFFSIPVEYANSNFNAAILLFVILTSSMIMSIGLMAKKEDFDEREKLTFDDWEALDREIEDLNRHLADKN